MNLSLSFIIFGEIVVRCVYGVLRYLSSIAIMTTTRDRTTHLALVHRPIPYIIDLSHTTSYNSRQPTRWLHDSCLEVLTVHYNELFGPSFKAELWLHTLSHSTMTEPWTHNLPVPSECAINYPKDAVLEPKHNSYSFPKVTTIRVWKRKK